MYLFQKTLFDNGTFQVSTRRDTLEYGFGDEYTFDVERLIELVNFLLLREEIVLVESDCQSDCPILGLSTCRPDKSLSCPVSGCPLG